jgi:hypothetical protein
MKTATVIQGGYKTEIRCTTICNRAAWWVIACDSYGNKEVVFRTNCEGAARTYRNQRVEEGRDYTVNLECNIIGWL